MTTINLWNKDCLPAMREMKDRAFELSVVDPPYGIGEFCMTNGDGGKRWSKRWSQDWNYATPPVEYFNEIRRVSNNQIIWGANYYNCFDGCGGAIVWFKHVKHPSMSKCEIASSSFHKRVEYIDLVWQNLNRTEPIIHPCQKPVRLYEWLLKNYAKPGDRILDTHLGSGSSAIACDIMRYDFTGYEIDKDYYEAAVRRLEQHQRQGVLSL